MSGLSPQGEDNARLRTLATLQEHTFHSDVPLVGPLIAWFRGLWNNVSTRWYVRPVIQQQSEFNLLILDQLAGQADISQKLADRLNACEARINEHDSTLHDHDSTLHDHDSTLHDHDAWLVAQDHEQADTVRDLAEASARLIQMRQSLDDLDARLVRWTKRGP